MEKQEPTVYAWARVALVIGSCFLLASTGWLSWLARIQTFVEPVQTEVLTLVLSYLVQAVGIAVFAALARGKTRVAMMRLAIIAVVAFVVLIVPATLSDSIEPTLLFGYLANLACGGMFGYFSMRLSAAVVQNRRGTAFGCAYGATTLATWLLSLVGDGMLCGGVPCLVVCAVLAALAITAIVFDARADAGLEHEAADDAPSAMLVALACATVVMASLVKSTGAGFSAKDLSGVNLEFSRVLYGVGLVIAGLVSDRNRRVGMMLCVASLALPFLSLALTGADASPMILWSLEYLVNGFFMVFCVTLAADFAERAEKPWLAGLGLLLARTGDALGTLMSVLLAGEPLALVAATTVVFAVAVALMLVLGPRLYETPVQVVLTEQNDRDPVAEFCAEYGLSAREREVLPLLVAGSTNAEIASELFVTERTVKFHVHNIMEKTACSSRLEVTDLFNRVAE